MVTRQYVAQCVQYLLTSKPVIGPPPCFALRSKALGVGRMVKQEHAGGRDVAPIGAGLRVPRALPVGLHATWSANTEQRRQ